VSPATWCSRSGWTVLVGTILFDVSLRVEPGEVVCLLGRNGAGICWCRHPTAREFGREALGYLHAINIVY
jgi:hypothetical protein